MRKILYQIKLEFGESFFKQNYALIQKDAVKSKFTRRGPPATKIVF